MKKLKKVDRDFIRQYVVFCIRKYNAMPSEYECSSLIEEMNMDYRDLVEQYLSELQLQRAQGELK